MPEKTPFDLDGTIAATWRAGLIGDRPSEKPHWRTKVAYYAAVCELVAAAPQHQLTWQHIVDAVRPQGSRSTFYGVAGRRAKCSLIAAYRGANTPDALQIAYSYHRQNAVDMLIDEAKVWAFWPYRMGWLRHCEQIPGISGESAAHALTAVLAVWSRHNPALAAALDHAPPACAVEDLVAVRGRQLPALRVHDLLRDAMRPTRDGGIDLVLPGPWHQAAVGDELNPPTPGQVLLDLAKLIHQVGMDLRRLSAADGATMRAGVSALMADALAELAAH